MAVSTEHKTVVCDNSKKTFREAGNKIRNGRFGAAVVNGNDILCARPGKMLSSVTRLDDFWKFLATKFLAKEAQLIANFLGYFEKPHSYLKTTFAIFLGYFWKNTGYFILQHLVTLMQRAVVVAQLVEWSLPIPEPWKQLLCTFSPPEHFYSENPYLCYSRSQQVKFVQELMFFNGPNPASFLFSFFSHDKYSTHTINEKALMACLGLKPGVAGW